MKALKLTITLAAASLLSSCFTEGYDLGQLNTTVRTDVDITLPQSSSGPVELRNVLTLSPDGLLKVVKSPTGEEIYALSDQGTHEATINAGNIRTRKPKVKDFDSTLDLRMPSHQHIYSVIQPDFEYHYTIAEGKAVHHWDNQDSPGLSHDIVRIDHVECEDNEMRMSAKVEGLEQLSPNAHLDDIVIKVPEDVHFKQARINGYNALKIAPGRITLTAQQEKRNFDLSKIEIVLEMDTLRTGHDLKIDTATHTLVFSGQMELTGTLRLTGEDILKHHPDYATTPVEIPEVARIFGHMEFASDIVAKTFTGRLHREVKPQEVELKNLPGILKEEGVRLDLSEPMIFATVMTAPDASAEIKASVSSESMLPEKCSTPRVPIEGGGKVNKYYLGCNHTPRYYPLDTRDKKYSEFKYYEVENLRKLLTNIAADKKITLEVDPVEAECRNIAVHTDHKIQITHELLVPLSFGEDFRLVYQGTLDNLNLGDGLPDITLSADAFIEVQGEVNNGLPLGVTLSLDLLNQAGESLADVVEVVNASAHVVDEEMVGVRVSGNAEKEKFKFVVRARQGHNLLDLLNPGPSQLGGLHYRVVADHPVSNESVKPRTRVSVDNVLIRVCGKAEM